MIRPGLSLAILSLFLLFFTTTPVIGQQWTEPLSASGHLRIEATSIYLSSYSRFGQRVEDGSLVKEVEPLGYDFTSPNIGSRLFPTLSNLENQLGGLTDDKEYAVNLGASVTNLTRHEVRIPINVSIGIQDYMTLGVSIPITRRRAEVTTSFNSRNANVGISPSITNMTDVDVFLSSLATAETDLARITQSLCSPAANSAQCIQANNILEESARFRQILNNSYTSYGVFPLQGSNAGNSLQLQLDALASAQSNLGVITYPTTVPLANQPMSSSHYESLITDPSYNIAASPLRSWSSPWEIGDIELFSNFKLLANNQNVKENGTSASNELHYLMGFGGLVRLGTGHLDLVDNMIDIGSGDGQNDFELKVYGNLSKLNLWSVWAEVTYGLQRPTSVAKRIATSYQAFPSMTTIQITDWTPGAYTQLRFSPSYQLTNELTFLADSRYFKKQSDRYSTGLEADCHSSTCLNPKPLEDETRMTFFEVGGGFVFSSQSPSSTRPLRIRLLYRAPLTGSGGMTAQTTALEFGIQILQVF
ncbi:MAG: hypothetical protein ACJ0RV_04125 [Longimicrobiales bacterium]